ncbi:multidrug resistance efflux pump [Shimia isoporae]|uniref:Multidrug resistance efflux pump n=1 Tax=Shimia isoporae TaxID=647720 RepID=A0A4R1NS22_9RHOB|nr:biotin/lipoyl-binding protein [Shimia isoporae]TCL09563.1 multidrug resistance efflux pump [Shimia isoporae]
MIELVLTSFPFILRVVYLRWRGIPVTLYTVHWALFLWLVLALAVFFTVFYYYPKSYTGIVAFRTIPVVAENSGTVTSVAVSAGDRVQKGDLLFTVDDGAEKAAVLVAERKIVEAQAAIAAGKVDIQTAEAALAGAQSQLEQIELTLEDQEGLRQRGSAAFQQSELERAQNTRELRLAEVDAAQRRLDAAKLQVASILPARLESAEAILVQAKVDLNKTQVFAASNGIVEQLTLHVGARASQLALNPSMVIIPDRPEDEPPFVSAGFSQVTKSILHEGMAAEVACDSSFNISMRNTVLPARVARIQSVVSTGQMTPSGRLIEPGERAMRGDIVVHLELVHPEHQAVLMQGSGCMVQTYTTHVTGALEGGVLAHGIEALGVLKAVLLRIKVWIALAAGIGLGGGAH